VAAEAGAAGLPRLDTVVQEPQNGTAHAVEVALPALDAGITKVVVVNGDAPLLTADTLARLADVPVGEAALLTAILADPSGYGRVLRGDAGHVTGIVEDRDANDDERAVREVNGGMYAFDRAGLEDLIAAIGADNDQAERYVTDVVGMLVARGVTVEAIVCDETEIAGVNDRVQLADAAAVLRRRHLEDLMRDGVTVMDPATSYVDVTVTLDRDAVLLPGCLLQGDTHVGEGAVIGPYTQLTDTHVEAGARVRQSVCQGASIGPEADVGPFTYLRPGARLERRAKTGGFVEVKQSVIGEGSKVPHLSYVGDTTMGAGVNFSAGAITVNYDGTNKHPTVIGDGAFVGCDTMLVAPVTIGDGAFVAAGSTVTHDVPADALAIARSRQAVKDGWAARRRAAAAGDQPGDRSAPAP
jgi:bifunctional UDP-N-acetylglucosamine pyrophosphorylase / glucosamine-1-phosphate N-acetyltransferase